LKAGSKITTASNSVNDDTLDMEGGGMDGGNNICNFIKAYMFLQHQPAAILDII